MPLPDSAIEFLRSQADRVRAFGRTRRIVFPEGGDARVQATYLGGSTDED